MSKPFAKLSRYFYLIFITSKPPFIFNFLSRKIPSLNFLVISIILRGSWISEIQLGYEIKGNGNRVGFGRWFKINIFNYFTPSLWHYLKHKKGVEKSNPLQNVSFGIETVAKRFLWNRNCFKVFRLKWKLFQSVSYEMETVSKRFV